MDNLFYCLFNLSLSSLGLDLVQHLSFLYYIPKPLMVLLFPISLPHASSILSLDASSEAHLDAAAHSSLVPYVQTPPVSGGGSSLPTYSVNSLG